MNRFMVLPEVAGSLGPQSEIDRSRHPPVVTRLHYEFSGWSGDDLVETFPCFLVTQALADAIARSGMRGAEFDDVIVTKDPQFEMFQAEVAARLPRWRWLRILNGTGAADFSQDDKGRLIVSQEALELLRLFRLDHSEVVEV